MQVETHHYNEDGGQRTERLVEHDGETHTFDVELAALNEDLDANEMTYAGEGRPPRAVVEYLEAEYPGTVAGVAIVPAVDEAEEADVGDDEQG